MPDVQVFPEADAGIRTLDPRFTREVWDRKPFQRRAGCGQKNRCKSAIA
jgi:hypothetical protein